MALKNILPSLQSEPKDVRVSLSIPRMPNLLDGVGETVNRAGQMAQSQAFRAASMMRETAQKEDNLLLAEEANKASRYIADEVQKQIFGRSGAEASGSGKRFAEIVDSARKQFGQGLSPDGFRRFSLEIGQREASYSPRVLAHEDGELRQASLKANNQGLGMDVETYAATGNAEAFVSMESHLTNAIRAANGSFTNEDSLRAFDEDVKMGRANAADRPMMEARASQYREARDRQVDLMHSARVERLLKDGDIAGARAYLNANGKSEHPAMSRDAFAIADRAVKAEERNLSCAVQAEGSMTRIKAAGGARAMGGRYWMEAQEQAAASEIRSLTAMAAKDPTGMAAHTLSLVKAQYTALESLQKANLAADTAEIIGSIMPEVNDETLATMETRLYGAPDSPLRDALKEIYVRNRVAWESKNKPTAASKTAEHKLLRERLKESIKAAMSYTTPEQRVYPFKDRTYHLDKPEELRAVMCDMGFSEEEKEELILYAGSPGVKYSTTVANMIADVMNDLDDRGQWTMASVRIAAPGLVDDVLRDVGRVGVGLSKDESKAAVKQAILQRLALSRTKPGFLWNSKAVLSDVMAESMNDDGTVDGNKLFKDYEALAYDDEQLKAAHRIGVDLDRAFNAGGDSDLTEEEEGEGKISTSETASWPEAKGRVRNDDGLWEKKAQEPPKKPEAPSGFSRPGAPTLTIRSVDRTKVKENW